jgi:DNA-binding XRE family transcriptional regulator
MRLDVFDARTSQLGATTDPARADLIGVDRVTMWRYRTGRLKPSLNKALTIAAQLDIPFTDLFEQVAA